jgi:polyhydroxyalkanoate synthase
MTERADADLRDGAPADRPTSIADVAERSRRLLIDWLARNGYAVTSTALTDPMDLCGTFLEFTAKMMTRPQSVVSAQVSLWQCYLDLWLNATSRLLGQPPPSAIAAPENDPRFADAAWEEHIIFSYIKQSYLLTSRWLLRTVHDVGGLTPPTRQKVDHYTRQFVNALSPTNFALTNPEVVRAAIETRGENLLAGLNNLLHDLETWSIASLGSGAAGFAVGTTIATAPGKVVYRNELIELIQYAPTSERVLRPPLLVVPSWINKYYLFDLRDETSWVKWAVGRGHTVFMISWVNPDQSLADASFEDYVLKGPVAAIEAIGRATGERVNAIGHSSGGTLLATALAWLAARGEDRVLTATLLAAMLDFSQPGELGISIDEASIAWLEEQATGRGYVDSAEMSMLVNMLRENDLVWSFVVDTYLLGRDRFPFDLCYWNSDTTRTPPSVQSFCLRNFYQNNRLIEPGGIRIAGVPIDLRRIGIPTYFLATREDHIAPWKATYAGVRLLGGDNRFTLAQSGHVGGVVCPPAGNGRFYWVNAKCLANPDEWLACAQRERGSWWPHWHAWVTSVTGIDTVPARIPGTGGLPALAEAPGTYVAVST